MEEVEEGGRGGREEPGAPGHQRHRGGITHTIRCRFVYTRRYRHVSLADLPVDHRTLRNEGGVPAKVGTKEEEEGLQESTQQKPAFRSNSRTENRLRASNPNTCLPSNFFCVESISLCILPRKCFRRLLRQLCLCLSLLSISVSLSLSLTLSLYSLIKEFFSFRRIWKRKIHDAFQD